MICLKDAGCRVVMFMPRFCVNADAMAPASIEIPPITSEAITLSKRGEATRAGSRNAASPMATAPASMAAPSIALGIVPGPHDSSDRQAQETLIARDDYMTTAEMHEPRHKPASVV